MFPVLVSLRLFDNDTTTLPTLRTEISTAAYEDGSRESRSCSCAEVQSRRHRFTLSNYGLDFRIILFDDQALAAFCADYGLFAAASDRDALSKDRQVELLNQIKRNCQCDSDVAQGALLPYSTQEKKEPTLQDSVEMHNTRCKTPSLFTSFHQVFRPIPRALQLQMKYKFAQARQRAIERDICSLILQKACGKRLGRMYIAYRTSVPGHYKVGFTTSKQASKRLHEQESCFKDLVLLKETTNIPWPQRVEQLVLKEQTLHRRAQDCGVCGAQHTEWLEMDLIRIEKSIKGWSNWIHRKPYRSDGRLDPIWEKRAKRALDKPEPLKAQELTNQDVMRAMQPELCEDDTIQRLAEFTEAGIDVHQQPSTIEWRQITQTTGSTRC